MTDRAGLVSEVHSLISDVLGGAGESYSRFFLPGHFDRLRAVLSALGDYRYRSGVFGEYSFWVLYRPGLISNRAARELVSSLVKLPALEYYSWREEMVPSTVLPALDLVLAVNNSMLLEMVGEEEYYEEAPRGGPVPVEELRVQAFTAGIDPDTGLIFTHYHQPVVSLLSALFYEEIKPEDMRLLLGFDKHLYEVKGVEDEGLIRVQGDLVIEAVTLDEPFYPDHVSGTDAALQYLPGLLAVLDEASKRHVAETVSRMLSWLQPDNTGEEEDDRDAHVARAIAYGVSRGLMRGLEDALTRLPQWCRRGNAHHQALLRVLIGEPRLLHGYVRRLAMPVINNLSLDTIRRLTDIYERARLTADSLVRLRRSLDLITTASPADYLARALWVSMNPSRLHDGVIVARLHTTRLYARETVDRMIRRIVELAGEEGEEVIDRIRGLEGSYALSATLYVLTEGLVKDPAAILSLACAECPRKLVKLARRAFLYSCYEALGSVEACNSLFRGEKRVLVSHGDREIVIDYTSPYRLVAFSLAYYLYTSQPPCSGPVEFADTVHLQVGDHRIETGRAIAFTSPSMVAGFSHDRLWKAANLLDEGKLPQAAASLLSFRPGQPLMITGEETMRLHIRHPEHEDKTINVSGPALVRVGLLTGIPYRVADERLHVILPEGGEGV